jgi:hypothetical protein
MQAELQGGVEPLYERDRAVRVSAIWTDTEAAGSATLEREDRPKQLAQRGAADLDGLLPGNHWPRSPGGRRPSTFRPLRRLPKKRDGHRSMRKVTGFITSHGTLASQRYAFMNRSSLSSQQAIPTENELWG